MLLSTYSPLLLVTLVATNTCTPFTIQKSSTVTFARSCSSGPLIPSPLLSLNTLLGPIVAGGGGVGTAVGSDVGLDVGVALGVDVGVALGVDVGVGVGLVVGLEVGVDVDSDVGFEVGSDVGLDVG